MECPDRPIMCCLDESAEGFCAAELAAALACPLDAPLIVAHAVSPRRPSDGWVALGPVYEEVLHDVHERERRDGEALLARAVGRLGLGDETQTLLVFGDPGAALTEAAAAVDAAALVVGTRRHGRLHRAVLGSVSGRLAADAPCPVVVVGGETDHEAMAVGPILCAVDGSADAERSAIVAAMAAERLGRELVLVHVLPSEPALIAGPAGESALVPGLWEGLARRDGWALLSALAATIGVRARLVAEPATGSLTATLANVARHERAACLMIGSRGRGPLRPGLLDSVSAAAAVKLPCALVVVPPGVRAVADLEERPAPHPRGFTSRTTMMRRPSVRRRRRRSAR